jgi:UDP-N-acetylmuramoyl-L-alanyl-D-glutamate--2,6-diaminopimelate ligase
MAAEEADVVVVTNEDPYDDDPRVIMEQIAKAAQLAGKKEGENLFIVEDRAGAIQKAVDLALPGDTVLVTGKGSELWMCVADGKKLPWSERKAVEVALRSRLSRV